MTKCTESGCRNLETKCSDCGRVTCDYRFPITDIQKIEINEYYNGMRWISIEETKPKDEQEILMTYNDFVMQGVYLGKHFYHLYGYNYDHRSIYFDRNHPDLDLIQEGITHWMPLPKPPSK